MKYLYTKKDCGGCETARNLLLNSSHPEFQEIPIDNPLTELGIQAIFNNIVVSPVLVDIDKGIYMLNQGQWVMVRNLRKPMEIVHNASN